MDVPSDAHEPVSADAAILARLERLDIGRPHRRLRMQAGLGYLFDSMDTATVALILPAVTALWGLSTSETGVLGSSVLIGFAFGAVAAGALADSLGRRRVMMYALSLFCLGSLVGALSAGWESLFAARIFTGAGCGAEAAIIAVYASEFVAARHRGRFVASLVMFFSFGWISAALLGSLVIPLPEGWRWIQVIGALPILLLLWWRRGLPESPRWLLAHGQRAEAHSVVAAFERESGIEPGELDPRTTGEPAGGAAPSRPGSRVRRAARGFGELFGRGLLRPTLTTFFLWFVVFFCFYGFMTWIPSLLVARGYEITRSFAFTILIYCAQAPGYYTAARLFAVVDQKLAMAVYFVGGAVSAFALSQATTTEAILVTACLLSFFMSGVAGGTYTYTPQVFPTVIRSSGAGAASAVGRLGAITAPIVIGTSYAAIGFSGVFTMLMIMMAVGAGGILAFGASTKGKTLEEIEREELGTVRSFADDTADDTAAVRAAEERDRGATSGTEEAR
jgi:putative MFS transporter